MPAVLAAIHAAIAVVSFGAAMLDAVKSGMLPILVYTIDFPASYPIIFLARTFGPNHNSAGFNARLLSDMAFFVVLGSAWWFGIGYVISRVVVFAKTRGSA